MSLIKGVLMNTQYELQDSEVLASEYIKAPKRKLSDAVKYGVATAVVATMQAANAAEITAVGQGLTGEIEAGKTIIIALFTAGAILLGIFAGFRYLKRGAGSA